MKNKGLEMISKENKEKYIMAQQERLMFIGGGMTAEKLYILEKRLDGVMDQLRDRFGIFVGDKTIDEIHDIRLIIEWFGKQIDPVVLNMTRKQ